ncbi:sulfatase [Pseudarthrobacter sp. NamE2]|uniref:sulfatase-like hydrolase/transferase n=1 Tax=Pseudarthrobacter sp. NamE2 TaxID=2576838 RepID=UPI0010FF1C7D|nr:sulfatase-like hydrolase/transferase [Pseudarthrobacter sp. NamE2]TLM86258.1 sulfatase [Pseudarthrobacter sp. NamE2]
MTRAIVVMFDSLNREYLPAYNAETPVSTPNFARLARRTVTMETSYAGSMPCMPARRELHTGRYNFLHRGWGPMEPFDDSVPEMLRAAGVHTHLATDHMHYWEDGGATYHTRYSTYSLIRGQQGDPWKGEVADPPPANDLRVHRLGTWRQDQINRKYMAEFADHPQIRTFDAAEEFIRTNHLQDRWMIQVETFDPHEPFFSTPDLNAKYDDPSYTGPEYEWPEYMEDIEDNRVRNHVRNRYSALTELCDQSLGRVLDLMDEYSMWEDTLLIVCTDHGFFLGEHGWWGKSVQPWYEEVIHTPLFLWDPSSGRAGSRHNGLVQTIDIAPTLLEHFGLEPTSDMQGISLPSVLRNERPAHDFVLFGAFGGQVNITDGRYVYMRTCTSPDNSPLHEHTLMPTHMRGFFTLHELSGAELAQPFTFTKGCPVLRSPAATMGNPRSLGTLLFDLKTDPHQTTPLLDEDLELRMCKALVDLLKRNDSPRSQFERLGLPEEGPVGKEHLSCARQKPEFTFLPPSHFPAGTPSVHTPIADLLADPATRAILERYLDRKLLTGLFPRISGPVSLYRATVALRGTISWPTLQQVAVELRSAASSRDMPEPP